MQKNVEKAKFPSTRYHGSKRDIVDWVWDEITSEFEFDSLLDLFGGTGAVAYKAKQNGKLVCYNDYLEYNHKVGEAIIENDCVTLSDEDVDFLLERHEDIEYGTVIQDEFDELYFTEDENKWLDMMQGNIEALKEQDEDGEYKKAIAVAALGQAALSKRPYNLFHRANLDMRLNDVDRSFGNKTTWEKPFEDHFKNFVTEYNEAVFENGRDNKACGEDALNADCIKDADVVYMDPPYLGENNGGTNYQYYYHFLEGFLNYDEWSERINRSVKTNRLEHEKSDWIRRDKVEDAFRQVFEEYRDSAIVVSYNTDSYLSPQKIESILSQRKEKTKIVGKEHQYALNSDTTDEVLIFGW